MKVALIIGFGGFIGSVFRYFVYLVMDRFLNLNFPFGTFAVNLIGSFLIGLVIGLSLKEGNWLHEHWKFFLATGFCGGFTTFSAFSLEGIQFINRGQFGLLAIYFGLSLILGVGMAALGLQLAK